MPKRTPKACKMQGCGGRSTESHGYCPDHAHLDKPWVRSKRKSIGGSRWQKLRDRVRRRAGGLCEECKRQGRTTVGSECDHIIPDFEDGTDAFENLQWLCKPCHAAKTREESRRAQSRGCGVSGGGGC